MFNSSWVPSEDPQILFSERCWLQGVIVAAIAYGINILLYVLSFRLLLYGSDNSCVEFKKRLPLLIYLTISFVLSTLYMISLAAFTQMAFVDNRNYPGGPDGFEKVFFTNPVDNPSNIAFALSNWLSDALVVWRFKVIYKPMCQVPLWIVMLFPCLMLAGSVVLGIRFLVQVSTTSPFANAKYINPMLPYLGLSLTLNIALTIAIVLRLLILRSRIVSAFGPGHGSHYISIASVTIESAVLYSAVSIACAVLLGIRNAVSHVVGQSLNQFQTTATLLIVYRVVQRKAWTGETMSHLMGGRRTDIELNDVPSSSPQVSIPHPLTGSGRAENGDAILSATAR